MDDGYKIYVTDWIYGLGRIVLVTTFQSSGSQLSSEVFMFGCDKVMDQKLFQQRGLTYFKNSEDIEDQIIDLEFMENEAREHGRQIIQGERARLFQKTNDRAHVLEAFELSEMFDNSVLSSLKTCCGYQLELGKVSENTKSKKLRAYLKFILSIKIETHNF